MKPFRMALPRTVNEAAQVSHKGADDARLLAGGTDLLAEFKERTQTPGLVVNLKHIPGLDQIRRSEDGGLEIGALVTLAALAAHQNVIDEYPALLHTIERTATPQIRNIATVGGNLCQRPRCWYYRDATYDCRKKGGWRCYAQDGENEFHAIFDNYVCCAVHPSNTAPVLIACDAEVEIASAGQAARWLPIAEFFVSPQDNVRVENVLEPGHVVTRVRIPGRAAGNSIGYVETREKESFDWASCSATVRLELSRSRKITGARVVLGAVAPTPVRRQDLEQILVGQRIDACLSMKFCEKLGDAAVNSATPLANNRYKTALVRVTLIRALRQAAEGGSR